MPGLERIERMFPFPLDDFQRDAVRHSLGNSSVVVCAPTGAGKTAIAVAAAVPVLAAGYRVIYTTPLKALSNQKLFELQVWLKAVMVCVYGGFRRTRKFVVAGGVRGRRHTSSHTPPACGA